MNDINIIKNLTYIPAFIWGLLSTGLDLYAMAILLAFMVIDTIFGILESGLIRGWQTIKSSRMIRGVLSKFMILLVPSVLLLAGKGAGLDFELFVRGTVTLLILAEAYSIIGHVYSVRTGKQTSEFDAMAFVLSKVSKALQVLISDDKHENK